MRFVRTYISGVVALVLLSWALWAQASRVAVDVFYVKEPGSQSPKSILEKDWTPSDSRLIHFGAGESRGMIRLKFTQAFQEKLYLAIPYPHLDRLILWKKLEGQWQQIHVTGDTLPFGRRQHKDFLFTLDDIGAEQEFALSVEVNGEFNVPLNFYTEEEFLRYVSQDSALNGLYFGAMVIVILFNLALFLLLRDKDYLYYTLFVFFFTSLQFILKGYAFQYIWGNFPQFNLPAPVTAGCLSLVTASLFTNRFLRVKKRSLGLYRTLQVSYLAPALPFFIPVMGYPNTLLVFKCLLLVFIPAYIYAGALAVKEFVGVGKLYVLGWGILLMCSALEELFISGKVQNPILSWGAEFGAVVEAVAISVALAMKVKGLEKENQEARSEKSKISEEVEAFKKLEEELKESEQAMRSLMEATLEAIVIVSDTEVLEHNKMASIIFRGSVEMDLKGLPLEVIFSKELIEKLHLDRKDKIGMFARCEHVINKRSGQVIHLCIEKRPHLYKGQKVCALSINDISEHCSHIKIIQEQQMQIVEGARLSAIGEMATGIAHEINNPLFIIISKLRVLLKLLEMEKFDAKSFRAIVESVDATANRIAHIIKGMRSVSRDSENDPLEKVALKAVVDETLTLCQRKMKSAEVLFSVEGDVSEELCVYAREAQLIQVLLNLFNNAVDALEKLPQKWIRLVVEDGAEKVRLRVVDSGSGISEVDAARIFTPFYTSKEPGRGTGLGLSLSRKIIESFGGKIYVDADYRNTCFVIEINKEAVMSAQDEMLEEDLMAL